MKNKYLEHAELIKGLNPVTIRNYNFWLSTIERILDLKDLEKVTQSEIERFITKYRKEGVHPKTINLHLIVLKTFLKYCNQQEIKTINLDSISLIKVGQDKINIPKKEEFKKLFNTELPAREKAIVELLFSTGMRISELKKIRIENIEWEEKRISISGKGGKLRLVFLSDKAMEFTRKYIGERKSGYVFPEAIVTLQRLISDSARKIGIKERVTAHMIRHLFATNMLENGANLYDVKKFMGHKNISTTERYLHVSDNHLTQRHQEFHKNL